MAFYPKQRDVPIAEYSYRHEAEFAAGFLENAGIPFRLQTDDAGGADSFMTITRPARLWVRREDVDEARDVLELDVVETSGTAVASRSPARPDASGAVLVARERLLAGTVGSVSLVVGLGITPVVLSSVLTIVSFVLALAFGIAAVFGRTVAPVRLALRMFSGHMK